MITPDFINGSFEILGAPFIFLSIIKLYKDKEVRGVSWAGVCFFTLWGFWNLYYFSHLGQYVSFVGGILIVSVNFIWLGQIVYYLYKERKRKC